MKQHRSLLYLAILLALLFGITLGDTPTETEIKSLMTENWDKIEDYEVDIKLSLNIPGFRMPSRKIHYLFKSPDKSKVEVKGFAIIPKQGIQPFFTFIKDSISMDTISDTLLNGKAVFEVVVEDTFMNKAGRISFYVDQITGSVYQASVTHDDREFFSLTSEYDIFDGIIMPISTDMQMKFPPDFKNIQRLGKNPSEMKEFDEGLTDEWLEGSIKIKFENYKVNQGIPDYVFEDEQEDKIQD